MIKVLFCAFKYDYGKVANGLSVEYTSFFGALEKMDGVTAEFFATDELALEMGRDEMNKRLVDRVQETQPDLLFCYLFAQELKKETISFITQRTKTKTFNWFADDHWRLFGYSRYWAPLFSFVSTTDSLAPARYKHYGINNVIKTQWGANQFLYKPQSAQSAGDYGITFVGQNFGDRGRYVKSLQAHSLPAVGFGNGWDKGRVSFEQMLNIFSFSKINLNFTKMPYIKAEERLKLLAKLLVKKELGQYKFNGHHIISNFQAAINSQRNMIKGRNFEIPACGGFQISEAADNLEDYYVPGKEIVIFKTTDELIEKSKHYLEHSSERSAIAKAGYERTLKQHTYEQRFKEILKTMGLM